jgi:hypothetical protein
MCSYAQWETLVRRVEEVLDEGRLRDVVSDVAARIDAVIDEIVGCGCVPENGGSVRGRGRRSRPEWVV